jgi:hypothetical protein
MWVKISFHSSLSPKHKKYPSTPHLVLNLNITKDTYKAGACILHKGKTNVFEEKIK